MNVLDVFLAEVFPPKKPAAGAKPGGGKPVAVGKPPTAVGGKKPPMGDDDALSGGPVGMGGGMGGGMGDNSDALIAAQQAKEEQEKAEAEARAASVAADQAERDRVKEMRAAADAEVADDLSSKFSDTPDEVIWHPTIDAVLYGGLLDDQDGFASHMDLRPGL